MEKQTQPIGKPRTKTCAKCGRELSAETDFYRPKDSWCKECYKAYHKERYLKRRKVKDGVCFNPRKGISYIRSWHSFRIYWSSAMVEKLKRIYPTTKNADCAVELGMSVRSMANKARELGLRKSPQWLLALRRRNLVTMHIINRSRRNSGMFQKGHRPHNARTYANQQP